VPIQGVTSCRHVCCALTDTIIPSALFTGRKFPQPPFADTAPNHSILVGCQACQACWTRAAHYREPCLGSAVTATPMCRGAIAPISRAACTLEGTPCWAAAGTARCIAHLLQSTGAACLSGHSACSRRQATAGLTAVTKRSEDTRQLTLMLLFCEEYSQRYCPH
jgi:hypothetical protein